MSTDPQGKQHMTGFIMRQGLDNELIRKGKRRMKGLTEGEIQVKAIDESLYEADYGPMTEGQASFSEILKCMSTTVNYNQPEVERVNLRNFRFLALVCFLLIFFCATLLGLEIIYKTLKEVDIIY